MHLIIAGIVDLLQQLRVICTCKIMQRCFVVANLRHIDTIAVGCLDADVVYPCGKCRQLMNEFGVKRIIVQDGEGGVREHSLEELLPYSFGPESLPD